MIIGLTGKTGSGKTTAALLLEENGFFICDTDKIARDILSPSSDVLYRVCEVFGTDIVKNGVLDRKLLAKRAFKDAESTEKLNNLTHPAILEKSFSQIDLALSHGYEFAVLDAPALFESGADKRCDFIVTVAAPESVRLARILERDNITLSQAEERIKAQKEDGFYTDRADFVIINDGKRDMGEQIQKLIALLKNR